MDDKTKGTKKTIADELLEDNFFKPPIDDIIEEAPQEKAGIKKDEKVSKEEIEKDGSLLFDDFLKSPADALPDEVSSLTAQPATTFGTAAVTEAKTAGTTGPRVLASHDTERTGSKLKTVVASLSAVIVVLSIGLVYLYIHHSRAVSLQSATSPGSRTAALHQVEPRPIAEKPAPTGTQRQAKNAAQSAPAAATTEQKGNQSQNTQVAEAVPPVATPQPQKEAAKQFEVILENVRTKAALKNAKRIGEAMDTALSYDVTENKKENTEYDLFVNKVYASQGEATADNLKLMVANISNASVIKADGGYRILVGKYTSKARAMVDIKNVEAAGLKGLLKGIKNTTLTYTVKVYPFKSAKEADTYKAKVRRLAAQITAMEKK